MGVFIWFIIRDSLLILAGVFLIITDHPGWAALLFTFYLLHVLQSFRNAENSAKQ